MIDCTFEDGGKALLRHLVVDTLVFKDGKILMVKRAASLLEGGKWGIVGGYAELNETMEEAATREVMEETGWEITGLTLLALNDRPDRRNDDRQNVAFVYFCEATEQTGEPDWESDEQRWYDLDDLPPRDQIAFDHADFIDTYKRYLEEKPDLPIIMSSS